MELYFAGTPGNSSILDQLIEEIKPNFLFSYLGGRQAAEKYKDALSPGKLFIDSGAFTAWTKGTTIDTDEYIDWINERSQYIHLYAQVDVIPGDRIKGHTQEQVEEAAEATWKNYLYMRPKMKNPEGLLYTFHVGEPYKYLERALEWTDENGKHIPYIALGGMVGKSTIIRKAFLDACYTVIKRSSNPNVKVHAFGMTSLSLLEKYPITSADSSSWIAFAAFGKVTTDAGVIEISDQKVKWPTHYSHLPKKHQAQFEKTLEEFGFTLEELKNSRENRIIFNARYAHKKSKEIQYKPGPLQKSLF